MTSKGQLTVPKAVRDALGIGAGDRVEFIPDGQGGYSLRPVRGDLTEIRGLLQGRVSRPMRIDEMTEAVEVEASERARSARDR